MAWQPKFREQSACLLEGEYDAEILRVDRKTSKAGNTMAVVTLSVAAKGPRRLLRDYIVQGWANAKVRALAHALGRSAEHHAGTFRLGEQVHAPVRVLITQEYRAAFGWCNRVSAYIASGLGAGPDVMKSP